MNDTTMNNALTLRDMLNGTYEALMNMDASTAGYTIITLVIIILFIWIAESC